MGTTVHDLYTGEALAAFAAAYEHAARRGTDPVAPDHLLLGLLDPPEGDSDERVPGLLATLGAESSSLAANLVTHLGPASPAALAGWQGYLNQETLHVIEHATQEANGLSARQIDTSHLLLGLLRCEGHHTGTLLSEAGLTADALRDAVRALPRRFTPPPKPLPQPERLPLAQSIRPSPIFLGLLGVALVAGVALALDPTPALVRPLTIAFIVAGWIAAVCIHEFGHCLAAYLGGDHGVVQRGGLTFDPRRYSHPLLSIGLPLLFLLGGSIGLQVVPRRSMARHCVRVAGRLPPRSVARSVRSSAPYSRRCRSCSSSKRRC